MINRVINSVSLFFFSILVILPTSFSISLVWNFGSLLGIILVHQIVTGILLVFHFNPDSTLAYISVQYIMCEVTNGWFFRVSHFNGASFMFLVLYIHLFNGLFFFSYRLTYVWVSGLTLLLLFIAEAFLGYVLVWGQMSFWAAIVITSLLSVVPYLSTSLLLWVWGGFSVNNTTLGFFFTLHFLLPILSIILVLYHLDALHETGSTSILFCHGDYDKITFFPYLLVKDSTNLLMWCIFYTLSILYPFVLGDNEIFIEANSLVSPVHIVPEWYFLFAYAILRSIPNKIIGVIALLISIMCLFYLVINTNFISPLDNFNNFLVVVFFFVCVLLTWLGQCPVEYPFITLGQLFSLLYFSCVFLLSNLNSVNNVI